jgi:hypothetical protein
VGLLVVINEGHFALGLKIPLSEKYSGLVLNKETKTINLDL